MERLYPNLILDALKNVRYPASGRNLVEAGMVEDDIRIDGNKVSFSLIFDRPTDPFIKSIVKRGRDRPHHLHLARGGCEGAHRGEIPHSGSRTRS